MGNERKAPLPFDSISSRTASDVGGAWGLLDVLKGWSPTQKSAVTASYLAWTLDALDFFLLVFVIKDVAGEFHVGIPAISLAVTLTLAMRPVGAFLFGRLADKFGRRPVLMINIAVYSLLSFSTAFVPNFSSFIIVRAAFGVGMGGVWGIGSSLSMETIKPEARGIVSGLLQSGYSTGYLLASLIFGCLYSHIGWRGMFTIGFVPALLLIPYVYAKVPESPSFGTGSVSSMSTFALLRQHWKLAIYAIMLMTAFNFFSHGTQDLYPTFLQKQHFLSPGAVGSVAFIYNVGAVLGCLLFGSLSQRFGRRKMMVTAALLAVPTIWLWAYSPTLPMLTVGAFLINFFVQGCWSVIPAHLNELSPAGARGTFPGTVYQLGNLIASSNLTIQALIVEAQHSYSIALAAVAFTAAVAITIMLVFGPEAHGVDMQSYKNNQEGTRNDIRKPESTTAA